MPDKEKDGIETDGTDSSHITIPVIEESALAAFFGEGTTTLDPSVLADAVIEAFDAMMEGVALLLDLVGQIEFTYDTKSGNRVHVVMDSP